jgi:hypothetical protein
MSLDKRIGDLSKFTESFDKAIKEFSCMSDFKYAIENCKDLFERFAPCKIGDRVELTKTPDINPKDSWGWMDSKHFLIKGAVGTVKEVDFYHKKFKIGIEFDNETWKNTQTDEKKPVERKHIYTFSEDFVKIQGNVDPWIEDNNAKVALDMVKKERDNLALNYNNLFKECNELKRQLDFKQSVITAHQENYERLSNAYNKLKTKIRVFSQEIEK